MPRSSNIPAAFREPKILLRIGLGILLLANIVAAVMAFHLVGASPESLNADLVSARSRLLAAKAHLDRTRAVSTRVEKGKDEGASFLNAAFTTRRHTYSTIISEITQTARTAGMNMKEATIAPLDAIEGSDDLDMMTISVNFDGTYPQLVKFVNLLDRSPKFIIIDSLQAAPQPNTNLLTVALKINTFVRESGD